MMIVLAFGTSIPFSTFLKNVVAENETYALKLNAEQAG